MRALILVVLALGAAFMGYLALEGECPGGQVFADEAACRASGAGAPLCRDAFASARVKATLEYSPFVTENDCALQFPRCQPHGRLAGYVPVPRGVCVAAGRAGTPIYERFGQRAAPR